MAAPRVNPTGFFEVISSARLDGKLELFGYGQHEKAISPGDLVIVTTNYLQDGFKNQQIQASLKIRGRDMHLFRRRRDPSPRALRRKQRLAGGSYVQAFDGRR
jgi:hypothetical protein